MTPENLRDLYTSLVGQGMPGREGLHWYTDTKTPHWRLSYTCGNMTTIINLEPVDAQAIILRLFSIWLGS